MNKRTVIFLGAGASKPHGYPLTDSILPAIWQGLSDGSWERWPGMRKRKDRRTRARELRELLVVLLPGLGRQRDLCGGASIVDVISLLDQLIVEGCSPRPKLGEDQIRRARAMLQLGINAVLRGTKQRARRNRFVDWVLSEAVRSEGNRVTLLSTNYDTSHEQRLYDRLVLVGASVGQHVDFGIPWRDSFRDLLHVRPRDARLAVFKLHGSLNWLRCETCGHVSINVRQRIASLEFWPNVWRYNECYCGGRLRSVVVTPSVVRDIRDANLLSVWNAALEDLRKAHEWIMIGYSLPSEDIAVRSLLLRAFHARTRRKSLRIRVVQWEPPHAGNVSISRERARYRVFFPSRHLRDSDYLTDGVEPFVDQRTPLSDSELMPELRRAFPRVERSWLRRTPVSLSSRRLASRSGRRRRKSSRRRERT